MDPPDYSHPSRLGVGAKGTNVLPAYGPLMMTGIKSLRPSSTSINRTCHRANKVARLGKEKVDGMA